MGRLYSPHVQTCSDRMSFDWSPGRRGGHLALLHIHCCHVAMLFFKDQNCNAITTACHASITAWHSDSLRQSGERQKIGRGIISLATWFSSSFCHLERLFSSISALPFWLPRLWCENCNTGKKKNGCGCVQLLRSRQARSSSHILSFLSITNKHTLHLVTTFLGTKGKAMEVELLHI